jgi:hypothetical protein
MPSLLDGLHEPPRRSPPLGHEPTLLGRESALESTVGPSYPERREALIIQRHDVRIIDPRDGDVWSDWPRVGRAERPPRLGIELSDPLDGGQTR